MGFFFMILQLGSLNVHRLFGHTTGACNISDISDDVEGSEDEIFSNNFVQCIICKAYLKVFEHFCKCVKNLTVAKFYGEFLKLFIRFMVSNSNYLIGL